jgi:hypothetical protein
VGGELDFVGEGGRSRVVGEKRTLLSESGDPDFKELFLGGDSGEYFPSSSSLVHAGFFNGPRALPLKGSMVCAPVPLLPSDFTVSSLILVDPFPVRGNVVPGGWDSCVSADFHAFKGESVQPGADFESETSG